VESAGSRFFSFQRNGSEEKQLGKKCAIGEAKKEGAMKEKGRRLVLPGVTDCSEVPDQGNRGTQKDGSPHLRTGWEESVQLHRSLKDVPIRSRHVRKSKERREDAAGRGLQ